MDAVPRISERQLRASPQKQELRPAEAVTEDVGIDDVGCNRSHAILQGAGFSRHRNGRFYHETGGEDPCGRHRNILRITWIDRKVCECRNVGRIDRAIIFADRRPE